MQMLKRLVLLTIVIIASAVVYLKVQEKKWADVNIRHYDGKILAGQEFDRILPRGVKRSNGSSVRAYFFEAEGGASCGKGRSQREHND